MYNFPFVDHPGTWWFPSIMGLVGVNFFLSFIVFREDIPTSFRLVLYVLFGILNVYFIIVGILRFKYKNTSKT